MGVDRWREIQTAHEERLADEDNVSRVNTELTGEEPIVFLDAIRELKEPMDAADALDELIQKIFFSLV